MNAADRAPDPAPGPPAGGQPQAPIEPLPDLLREDRPDRHHAVRVVLLLGAAVCLVLGVVFWLLPVVTGIPFYVLGAVLAGMGSRRIARWLNRQERRLPHRVRLLLRPKHRRARSEAERDARGE